MPMAQRCCSGCAPRIFRCFKLAERFADWLTGAAGPVFVALAWVLIGSGGFMFFEVVYPSTATYLPYALHLFLAVPSFLIALNLYSHYYLVCHIPPGRPDDGDGKGRGLSGEGTLFSWPWATPRRGTAGGGRGWLEPGEREREVARQREAARRERRCRKCGGMKPERTHHCSVCKSCILKYDHHCPWINGCVGLRNERHFVLFMAYLVIGCLFFTTFGWPLLIPSLDMTFPWPYYTPRIAYTILWVIAVALGIAVGVMCSWHVLQASWGETTVEGHDNVYYRQKKGAHWLPKWDLGRRRNLETFFNVGADGYPYRTLWLPLRIMTHSDGRVWEERQGWREVVDGGDELTDDEEGGVGG